MVDAVVALVGPTGAAKSASAIAAASGPHCQAVEIVAVDAFTLYRGMDIGTAKPTAAERAQVPHHLIDVLDPDEEATVEAFQRRARAAIADILRRGRVPLLVGGSGLYFRAAVDPLEFPPTDPAVRAALAAEFADDALAAHAALSVVDPDAAGRIAPENLRRILRALEVQRLTGRPFSDWRRTWEAYESIYPGLEVVGVDLARDVLAERIAARVSAMVAAGLVEECRRLRRRPLSSTARQAIGYAEVFAYLDGVCSLDDAIERIKARTRRYAARQQRWFRTDPRVRWTPPTGVVDALDTMLGPGRTAPA